MIREKKEQSVSKIEEWLSNSEVVIVTDYRGMTVSEIGQLRRQLGESDTEYHVVKNNMARIAAENAGQQELKDLLKGPSALAFGRGEVSDPARILSDFIRTAKVPMSIKGGLLGGRLLTQYQIASLATLPPRETLIALLMRQMQAPISSLLTVLSANMSGLLRVLEARKQQLEGG